LTNFSHVDVVKLSLLPLGTNLKALQTVREVHITGSSALQNIQGLGKNEIVVIDDCSHIVDLSALKRVPRLTLKRCRPFTNCEHFNQVRHLTVDLCNKWDFRPFGKNQGGNIQRLEIHNVWGRGDSLEGLGDIPFVKIIRGNFPSLKGLGENNRTIIFPAKYESHFDGEKYSVKTLPAGLIMLKRK
jgi:hypothetical protein